jgi:hypothetical protein
VIPWTMISSQGPVKLWLVVELVPGPLWFTPREKEKRKKEGVWVIMQFEAPKRHILRHALFTYMVQRGLWWERQKRWYGRKRQGTMAKKYCCNKILMVFFLGEWRWKHEKTKRMVKLNLFLFKTSLCGHILKKSTRSFFWCMVILGPHSVYT